MVDWIPFPPEEREEKISLKKRKKTVFISQEEKRDAFRGKKREKWLGREQLGEKGEGGS